MKNEIKDLTKYKEFYKSFKAEYCPVLDEVVYFTGSGFHHLLYESNRVPRTDSEINFKLRYLEYVPEVVRNAKSLYSEKRFEREKRGTIQRITFYAIIHKFSDTLAIKVVLGRSGCGKLKFVSVMPHKTRF